MKFYAFLADGFETVEALGVIDILRRGGVEVTTVSIKDTREVVTAQRVTVMTDTLLSDLDFEAGDAIFLPGGIPGTPNLESCKPLMEQIINYRDQGKYLVAICAAPSIFGHLGILKGKKATCYPGFEKDLTDATVTGDGVTVDGKIITARGMGKTIDLGLKLLELFTDGEKARTVGEGIQYLEKQS